MLKIFAYTTLLLAAITSGYGLWLHLGGQETEIAVTGHMILGILTTVSGLITAVLVLLNKQDKKQ